MEYPIGIEMAPEYLSYEVSKAAYKLVKEVMLVEPGENVVVTHLQIRECWMLL